MCAQRALAALARDAGLAEDALAIAQGGGLGAGDVCKPAHVGLRDLAEGHAARAALLLFTLPVGRVRHVLRYELRGRDVRACLVVVPVLPSPATSPPSGAVGVGLEPGGADAPLDLSAAVSPEGLVEGASKVFSDDQRCFRILDCHFVLLPSTRLRRAYARPSDGPILPWVADG